MNDDLTDRLQAVRKWLNENARVITQVGELTIFNFTYDPNHHSGHFQVSVDGEPIEEHWSFSLGKADGWTTICPPMFVSPLGAPASYAAVEVSAEIHAALEAKLREIFPRLAPLGLNRETGVEITMSSSIEDRIIDLEGYRRTVSEIENRSLSATVKFD